jgi:hypothetical protein
MYKWPTNAKLYKRQFGRGHIDVIVLDTNLNVDGKQISTDEQLKRLVKSSTFTMWNSPNGNNEARSHFNELLGEQGLYQINSAESESAMRNVADLQYRS